MKLDQDELIEQIAEAVAVLATLPKAPHRDDQGHTAVAWMLVLEEMDPTRAEIKQVTKMLIRDQWFPTPGRVSEALERVRDQRLAERVGKFVEAIDANGVPVLVDPRQIDGDRYRMPELPEGTVPEGTNKRPAALLAKLTGRGME